METQLLVLMVMLETPVARSFTCQQQLSGQFSHSRLELFLREHVGFLVTQKSKHHLDTNIPE